MTIEKTLSALRTALGGKSDEVTALNAKVTSLEAALAANAESLAAVEALKANETALAAKVTALEADLTAALTLAAELKAEKANAEAKVEHAGKKAAQIAASVGVEPVEVAPVGANDKGKTDTDISDEWIALKAKDAKAASVFYAANRAAIIRAAGLR